MKHRTHTRSNATKARKLQKSNEKLTAVEIVQVLTMPSSLAMSLAPCCWKSVMKSIYIRAVLGEGRIRDHVGLLSLDGCEIDICSAASYDEKRQETQSTNGPDDGF